MPEELIISIETFTKHANEIVDQVSLALNDENIKSDYVNLSLKHNEIWSRCNQLLKRSFKGESNEYLEKFKEQTYEIPVGDILSNNTQVNRGMISHRREQFVRIEILLKQFLNTIIYSQTIIEDLPSLKNADGLYFKGQYFDAVFDLGKLIAKVSKEIKLVDNYINLDLINFLIGDKNGIELKILTISKNINPLVLALKAIQKHNNNIEIRESNSFHDRFLIVDDKSFYHFGASLKDLGNKTFMFSKINEAIIISAMLNEFNSCWQSGNTLFQ